MPQRLYDASACMPDGLIGSYWETTAPTMADRFSALDGDRDCDVAILGAGYTGLSAALRLAGEHDAEAVVLDAGFPGWGASGRNGGFCCIGGDKLPAATMRRRYGAEATAQYERAQRAAVDLVADLLERHGIDADRQNDGDLYLIHRARDVDRVRAADGFLDRQGLEAIGAAGPEFHAGVLTHHGFGLNPMKYVQGLARAARDAGATVHAHSPVTALEIGDSGHRLVTPTGTLRARRVIVATNGYSSEDVPPALAGRLLPVLTNIITTRPMSAAELEAQGWTTPLMSYDSRNLLHYFRLLPDGRFLFGARGGTDASPQAQMRMRDRVRVDFERMFPAWRDVEDTHFWSGFACMTRQLVPHIGRLGGSDSAWAGLAYHGNGVSMGTWTGRQLADLAAGKAKLDDLPGVMTAPLRRFPFPALRRLYLKAAYAYYAFRDA